MTGGARNIACLGTRYDVLCTMLWKRSLHLNLSKSYLKKIVVHCALEIMNYNWGTYYSSIKLSKSGKTLVCCKCKYRAIKINAPHDGYTAPIFCMCEHVFRMHQNSCELPSTCIC